MTFSKDNLSKPEGFNNGADNLYDPYDFLGQGVKSGKSLDCLCGTPFGVYAFWQEGRCAEL